MSSLCCDEDLADEVVRSAAAASSSPPPTPSEESSFIARLLDSEPRHMPHPDYVRLCQNRSIHLTYRQDSINSILKIHAHFEFKPATAFLSINYFDRFLADRTLPETGWTFQLVSVACLSLAAKMEELYVPSLLDLQMPAQADVFEPKTIQRMELLVLATLKWRLRSVTPFDYLHYFMSTLPSSAAAPDSFSTVYSLASSIILDTTRVIDFMRFPPSVIAAAAVTSAAGSGADLPDTLDERINREMVRSCHQLMEEYLLDTCPPDALKAGSDEPSSPLGVLDAAACTSCDTHSENPAPASGSGSGSERETKRIRLSAPDVQEK